MYQNKSKQKKTTIYQRYNMFILPKLLRNCILPIFISIFASTFIVPWSPIFDKFLRNPIPVTCSPEESIVVITGISSGIGKDISEALAYRGYTVIGTIRKKRYDLADGIIPVICDITDPDGIKMLKDAVRKERASGKHLVALVNNAGIGGQISLSKWLSDESLGVEALRQFNVNFFGLLNVTQTLLPDLISDASEDKCGSTRLINIGSLAGYISRSTDVIYSATKASIERATDSMRRTFRSLRVWATIVEPGFVNSKICNRTECMFNLPSNTTTPAILHAITSPFPKSRYPVSTVGSFRAQTVVILSGVLPDSLMDKLIDLNNH